MVRRRRLPVYARENVKCDIKLDEDVAIPFDRLKQQFEDFAETQGIDLKDMSVSNNSIRGKFTDGSGVEFKINLKPLGKKSKLEGSISKKMGNGSDARTVGFSVEHFTEALFHG